MKCVFADQQRALLDESVSGALNSQGAVAGYADSGVVELDCGKHH